MSCLPQIFVTSKSQHIMPNKVGGQFSIHLRSAFFANKPTENIKKTSSFLSADAKRYRSWMDSEQTFKKTRRSSKSFFHKQGKKTEKAIQEKGFANENINARQRQQSQVEAVSNFNILKKTAVQGIIISQKVLDQANAQQQKISRQMAELKKNIHQQMDEFQKDFLQNLNKLHKAFKQQRRNMIAEGKAIAQQLSYLEEQNNTTKSIFSEIDQTFSKVIGQFV